MGLRTDSLNSAKVSSIIRFRGCKSSGRFASLQTSAAARFAAKRISQERSSFWRSRARHRGKSVELRMVTGRDEPLLKLALASAS